MEIRFATEHQASPNRLRRRSSFADAHDDALYDAESAPHTCPTRLCP
jgi:hypothetical protein